jgi:hypothetical protein
MAAESDFQRDGEERTPKEFHDTSTIEPDVRCSLSKLMMRHTVLF